MSEPVQAMTRVAVTGTNVYTSDIIEAGENTLLSLQFLWTGTPAGTILLYQSNLPVGKVGKTPANRGWTPVPTGEVDFTGKLPAGSEDSSLVNISATSGWRYLVTYTNATGSGFLDLYVVSKK